MLYSTFHFHLLMDELLSIYDESLLILIHIHELKLNLSYPLINLFVHQPLLIQAQSNDNQ